MEIPPLLSAALRSGRGMTAQRSWVSARPGGLTVGCRDGAFCVYKRPTPSGAYHCLNDDMIFALQRLVFGDHPRVQHARDWLARSIVGEQPIPYCASVVAPPGFACGVNGGQPCAWGANKALRVAAPQAGRRRPMAPREHPQRQDGGRYRDEVEAQQVGHVKSPPRDG